MTAPAWMPLYIADYLADTSHLSAAQSGAYLHLIMHYWQRGGLPDDDACLSRIARTTFDEWQEARPVLVALFLPGWKHKRVDEELRKARETMAKRSAAGKANASQRYANGMQMAARSHLGGGDGINLGEGEKTKPEEVSPRERELDRLEGELRAAAGLANDPSPSLFDISPMVALLDKGWDLRSDILPKLRAAHAAKQYGKSWRYYVPGIVEAKQKNGSIRAKASTTMSKNNIAWVHTDDPAWSRIADRYRREKHAEPTPMGSRQGLPGIGIHVPSDWLKEMQA